MEVKSWDDGIICKDQNDFSGKIINNKYLIGDRLSAGTQCSVYSVIVDISMTDQKLDDGSKYNFIFK